jgi:hypothetical protein
MDAHPFSKANVPKQSSVRKLSRFQFMCGRVSALRVVLSSNFAAAGYMTAKVAKCGL